MSSASTDTVPDSIFERSRMSLIRFKQIAAGAVNRAGELDLAPGKIAIRVVRELLAEDQDAVQRRAQLMRHVCKKLGLVLRGQRELGRLFLERSPSLLDFIVLAFDFRVLLGQLLRLLLELLIRQLELFLLGLQLGRQLLRLLEQALGLHGRFDTVEHDADPRGELIKESLLQLGERRDGRELDDRFHLTFEEHGQDDQVGGFHLEDAGPDRNDVGRHIRNERGARIDRALSDDALAQLKNLGMAVRARVSIGGQEPEDWRPFSVDQVDDAILRGDLRGEFRKQHSPDRRKIALSLQHVGEPCEIGLEPILFGIALGRQTQIVDHRVDVVFELGDFAARVD